jgi:hypothetical protein
LSFEKMVYGILQPVLQGMLESGPIDAALAATGMGAYGAYKLGKRKRAWAAAGAYKYMKTSA